MDKKYSGIFVNKLMQFLKKWRKIISVNIFV